MKTFILVRTVGLVFLTMILMVSCGDSSAKKDSPRKSNKEVKSEEPSKKNTEEPSPKSGAKKWNADPEKSQITFTANGPFGAVHGKLGKLQSTILFDEDNLEASSI